MAKVYDALRRAEEERKRRSGDQSSTPVAAFEMEQATPPAPKSKRFWGRFRGERRAKEIQDSSTAVNKRRISLLQPDSYVAEQFRALRGRIDALSAQHPIRSVVVTSAFPGEGKTTAAVNLAAVTALSLGRRVLLVDCDLRKPKVHQALGLRPEAGLAEVLSGQSDLDDAIVKVDGVNLEVLAVRGRPPNPSELLGSDRMRELMEELSSRYDRIIVDSPAALGLPDAKCVSELCDGMVMVVRADETAQQDVQTVLEVLDRRRVLGLLLNGAKVSQGRYGYAS